MKVFTTSAFWESFKKLEKRKKEYNPRKDLCKHFGSYESCEEMIKQTACISVATVDSPSETRKMRVKNSVNQQGKSAGYRVILEYIESNEAVCLLYIYPKTGKHGIDNYTPAQYNDFFGRFLDESESGELVKVNPENLDPVE